MNKINKTHIVDTANQIPGIIPPQSPPVAITQPVQTAANQGIIKQEQVNVTPDSSSKKKKILILAAVLGLIALGILGYIFIFGQPILYKGVFSQIGVQGSEQFKDKCQALIQKYRLQGGFRNNTCILRDNGETYQLNGSEFAKFKTCKESSRGYDAQKQECKKQTPEATPPRPAPAEQTPRAEPTLEQIIADPSLDPDGLICRRLGGEFSNGVCETQEQASGRRQATFRTDNPQFVELCGQEHGRFVENPATQGLFICTGMTYLGSAANLDILRAKLAFKEACDRVANHTLAIEADGRLSCTSPELSGGPAYTIQEIEEKRAAYKQCSSRPDADEYHWDSNEEQVENRCKRFEEFDIQCRRLRGQNVGETCRLEGKTLSTIEELTDLKKRFAAVCTEGLHGEFTDRPGIRCESEAGNYTTMASLVETHEALLEQSPPARGCPIPLLIPGSSTEDVENIDGADAFRGACTEIAGSIPEGKKYRCELGDAVFRTLDEINAYKERIADASGSSTPPAEETPPAREAAAQEPPPAAAPPAQDDATAIALRNRIEYLEYQLATQAREAASAASGGGSNTTAEIRQITEKIEELKQQLAASMNQSGTSTRTIAVSAAAPEPTPQATATPTNTSSTRTAQKKTRASAEDAVASAPESISVNASRSTSSAQTSKASSTVDAKKMYGAYIRGKTGPEMMLYPITIAAANGLYFVLRRRKHKRKFNK